MPKTGPKGPGLPVGSTPPGIRSMEERQAFAESRGVFGEVRALVADWGGPTYKSPGLRSPETMFGSDKEIKSRLVAQLKLPAEKKDRAVAGDPSKIADEAKARSVTPQSLASSLCALLDVSSRSPFAAKLAVVNRPDLVAKFREVAASKDIDVSAVGAEEVARLVRKVLQLDLDEREAANPRIDAEPDPAVRRKGESMIHFEPLQKDQVSKYLDVVGLPGQPVKVLKIPSHFVEVDGSLSEILMSTPLKRYPPGAMVGFESVPPVQNLADIMHEYKGNPRGLDPAELAGEKKRTGERTARDYFESLGGGAYDAKEYLVCALASHWSARVLLHELGHLAQEVSGSADDDTQHHEYNTDQTILEYHNVLKYENLYVNEEVQDEENPGDSDLRTFYTTKASADSGQSKWRPLRKHLASRPDKAKHSLLLLEEIIQILGRPPYTPQIARVIQGNLINEYFANNPVGAAAPAHNPASHQHRGSGADASHRAAAAQAVRRPAGSQGGKKGGGKGKPKAKHKRRHGHKKSGRRR